jgi:homospermidine synthase
MVYSRTNINVIAIGIVAALNWVCNNPAKGLCYPEALPYQEVLKFTNNFTGLTSVNSTWDPITTKTYFSLWDYGIMFGKDEFPTVRNLTILNSQL